MFISLVIVFAIMLAAGFIGSRVITPDIEGLGLDVFGGFIALAVGGYVFYGVIKLGAVFGIKDDGQERVSSTLWLVVALVAAATTVFILSRLLM